MIDFRVMKRPALSVSATSSAWRRLLALFISISVALITPTLPQSCLMAQTAERPNVLVILADDLGYGDLGCYGNPVLDTPVIDSLAAGGVKLTNHYAPSPLCSPSRAGFLTGRYNHRTGAVDVPSNRGLDRIALSETTFGDYFRHAGYATALIGKWHNGIYCKDYLPHRRGFDRFFGFANGGQDYWKWNLLDNDTPVPSDGRYLTDVLNEATIDFINGHTSEPFAIFLAHHVPHVPFQAPAELVGKYSKRLGDESAGNVATLYAMIEAMDRGLGDVFQTLKDRGLWQSTVIVFTSDNGAHLGKVNGESTQRFHAKLSGNKGDVGEQGIRVPAIVSWPGTITAGAEIDAVIHGCDWLPTLFSLTGAQAPDRAKPMDGLNVMPTFLGQPQNRVQSRVIAFQKNRYRPVAHSDAAIRQQHWKLTWPPIDGTFKKDIARDNPSYLRGLTNPHWEMPLDRGLAEGKYSLGVDPKLFDLTTDPSERNDLADKHPDLVAQMTRTYDRWFQKVDSDWQHSRTEILDHDREYWKDRIAPDARSLFNDFWQWQRAPDGVSKESDDPLKVFRGFWNEPVD